MTPEQILLANHMRAGQPLLPLSDGQATAQAYRLRMKHHLSYPAISRIMGEYHGVWKGETEWRRRCRRSGAPVVRLNNLPPHQRKAAA